MALGSQKLTVQSPTMIQMGNDKSSPVNKDHKPLNGNNNKFITNILKGL